MPVGSAAESRMVSTIVEPLVARSFDAAGMNGGGSIFATASWDAGDALVSCRFGAGGDVVGVTIGSPSHRHPVNIHAHGTPW